MRLSVRLVLEPIFKASDMPELKNLAAWDGTDEVTTRESGLSMTRRLLSVVLL